MFKSLFLWCSGTCRSILELCRQSKETETNRQATVGALILLTAAFAFGSSSYALYTLFGEQEQYGIRIIFICGFLWALMIFLLDRFLVSTLTITQRNGKPDEAEENIKYSFNPVNICIRLVLAIIIGITIATPLELRIFADEIEKNILEKERKAKIAKEFEAKSTFENTIKGSTIPEPPQCENRLNKLVEHVTKLKQQKNDART
jgi:hypothetical protein